MSEKRRFQTHDWHGEGRIDTVVEIIPCKDDFERLLYGDTKPILVADCAETDYPEGNAALIAKALEEQT